MDDGYSCPVKETRFVLSTEEKSNTMHSFFKKTLYFDFLLNLKILAIFNGCLQRNIWLKI